MNYILDETEYADYCKIIQEHAKLKEEQKDAYKKAQKLGNVDICVKIADETLNEMIRETDS